MKRYEREQMFQNFNQESGISSQDYYEAFRRVKRIKRFYVHVLVYILVNIFLIVGQRFDDEKTLTNDVFFHWHTYSTAFFWGIGLVAHGLSVFGSSIFFGNNWEERKIKQLMDKEKTNKFE
ncbi:2TM domain-containing protein [Flavobacterium sp. SUN052]|uniref:2TM domain-containing protein n=1 Tax=Flavobacterium sp. SUN052 TaxID=3002441 RepID=UPI00237EA49E|nr:2TM domain-containing protein [Flavobacterium sp. SUN052]MEC4005249.1 2TM domain-containing protein [Flavobacterium sp. SUN052]